MVIIDFFMHKFLDFTHKNARNITSKVTTSVANNSLDELWIVEKKWWVHIFTAYSLLHNCGKIVVQTLLFYACKFLKDTQVHLSSEKELGPKRIKQKSESFKYPNFFFFLFFFFWGTIQHFTT